MQAQSSWPYHPRIVEPHNTTYASENAVFHGIIEAINQLAFLVERRLLGIERAAADARSDMAESAGESERVGFVERRVSLGGAQDTLFIMIFVQPVAPTGARLYDARGRSLSSGT